MPGLPELIHYQFQEEENGIPEIEDRMFIGYHITMSQMPTSNNAVGCGFNEEVLNLLLDRSLDVLVPIFKKHDLSLYKFLTLKDNDLRQLGVEFSCERRDVSSMIKNFHLCQWQTLATCVLKSSKTAFTVVDGLEMVSRVMQQLYVETATLAYLRLGLKEMLENVEESQRGYVLKSIKESVEESQILAKNMQAHMKELHKNIVKRVKTVDIAPADFIWPQKSSRKYKKLIVVIAVTAIISLTLWKNNTKVTFLSFPKYDFSKWCIVR